MSVLNKLYKYRWIDTPLGPLQITIQLNAESSKLENAKINAVEFVSKETLAEASNSDKHPLLDMSGDILNLYFSNQSADLTQLYPYLNWAGTEFQNNVWQALITIPSGETRSYMDIANQVGNPKAVRAVGAANGKNPIAIIVPCHRVIGANGSLTGYAGGLDKKQWLLQHEQKQTSLFI